MQLRILSFKIPVPRDLPARLHTLAADRSAWTLAWPQGHTFYHLIDLRRTDTRLGGASVLFRRWPSTGMKSRDGQGCFWSTRWGPWGWWLMRTGGPFSYTAPLGCWAAMSKHSQLSPHAVITFSFFSPLSFLLSWQCLPEPRLASSSLCNRRSLNIPICSPLLPTPAIVGVPTNSGLWAAGIQSRALCLWGECSANGAASSAPFFLDSSSTSFWLFHIYIPGFFTRVCSR